MAEYEPIAGQNPGVGNPLPGVEPQQYEVPQFPVAAPPPPEPLPPPPVDKPVTDKPKSKKEKDHTESTNLLSAGQQPIQNAGEMAVVPRAQAQNGGEMRQKDDINAGMNPVVAIAERPKTPKRYSILQCVVIWICSLFLVLVGSGLTFVLLYISFTDIIVKWLSP